MVWVTALHRVCLDNTIFLPSFPMSNMSELELERAAMAPRRWINLCGAFKKHHLNYPGTTPKLCPRASRIIQDSFGDSETTFRTKFFLVPGGRYLVSSSCLGISVLDLGYTVASSADCKLIASVGPESPYGSTASVTVQATPDGMGLIIFSSIA